MCNSTSKHTKLDAQSTLVVQTHLYHRLELENESFIPPLFAIEIKLLVSLYCFICIKLYLIECSMEQMSIVH